MAELSPEYYKKKYPQSSTEKREEDLKTRWKEAMAAGPGPGKALFKQTQVKLPDYAGISKESKALGQASRQLPAGHSLRNDIEYFSQIIPIGFVRQLVARRKAQGETPAKLFPAGSLTEQALSERGIKNALINRFKHLLTPAARAASWEQIAGALNAHFSAALKKALRGE